MVKIHIDDKNASSIIANCKKAELTRTNFPFDECEIYTPLDIADKIRFLRYAIDGARAKRNTASAVMVSQKEKRFYINRSLIDDDFYHLNAKISFKLINETKATIVLSDANDFPILYSDVTFENQEFVLLGTHINMFRVNPKTEKQDYSFLVQALIQTWGEENRYDDRPQLFEYFLKSKLTTEIFQQEAIKAMGYVVRFCLTIFTHIISLRSTPVIVNVSEATEGQIQPLKAKKKNNTDTDKRVSSPVYLADKTYRLFTNYMVSANSDGSATRKHPEQPFGVRGHYRHYKTGKEIWVKNYVKNKAFDNKEIKDTDYILNSKA